MPSCTIGARSIEKKEFSCIIRKIECRYAIDKKSKKAVLFDRDNLEQDMSDLNVQDEGSASDGILYGGVSNRRDYEYYYITSNKGKKVEFECSREVNLCTESRHHQYNVDYIDIDSRELKTELKDITDGNVTLYYYDIFNRTWEYTKNGAVEGAKLGYNSSDEGSLMYGAAGGVAGGVVGATVGHFADLICSLRFIHLPRINFNDNEYAWHALFLFTECPHLPSVPTIVINTYPDIEFNLKLGFFGNCKSSIFASTKDDLGKGKTERLSFSFAFSVKYAEVTKDITFDKKVEDKGLKNEEEKQGSIVANAIHALKEFFEMAANFTQDLIDLIENTNAGDSNALEKQFKGLLYKQKGSDWLKGSLDIKPNLSLQWRYSVSDDLTKLGRHVEIELGIDCNGKLTIDLIKVGSMFLNKSKKATKVAAVATSVASGGLAALPAALITFLVDYVVDWLIDKFKEGLVFDLMLIGNANVKSTSLTIDTSKDTIFDGKGLTAEIKPEIKVVIGFDYKTSVVLFWFVKAEVEAKATAEAASSLTWKMTLDVKDMHLGVDHDVKINPLVLKIECSVVASYELSYSSEIVDIGTKHTKEYASYSNEWKTSEYKYDTKRHKWFKVVDGEVDAGHDGGSGR